MDTLPTGREPRRTRRQLQATIGVDRTEIAGLDRIVEEQARTINLVCAERDDAYQAVGRAEVTAAQLAEALDELRRLHDAVRAAEQVRDAALAAAEQAQAVTLKLLDVHHQQDADHGKTVRALAETVSDALSAGRPALPSRPEPPELLPGGTHALTSGEPGVLVPVDGPERQPARKQARR